MHSPSVFRLLILFAFTVACCHAGYTIRDDYNPSTFFSLFDFFTGPDPTHGFVQYVDEGTARNNALIQENGDGVYVGVDHNTISSAGRASVRLESRNTYTRGLFIVDIAHMPGGICGTWPAFWTFGPNWPHGGEIDIIEQVHTANNNHMTLHSGAGCTMKGGTQFGRELSTECFALVNGNQGCGVSHHSSDSYGVGFNRGGGGVYAMEWTSDHIAVWFWPRSAIPENVLGFDPNPSTWGEPVAWFRGPCDIDANFQQHRIVFNTTFCGDWAGNVWSSSECSAKAPSCTEFVANNPSAFAEAFWTIKSLRVFQRD